MVRKGRFSRKDPVGLESRGQLRKRPVEQILDACLADIHLHRSSIADCLAKYPTYARELLPLLTIAAQVKNTPTVAPTSEFKYFTRQQLLRLPGQSSEFCSAELPIGARLAYSLSRKTKSAAWWFR